jgi:GGDEF domain-containing protein
LARLGEQAGWQPIATRRPDGAERRFVASGASVAIVDARGSYAAGLRGVHSLASAVEVNSGALLVLVAKADAGGLDELFGQGATHFLVAPFSDSELTQAIRYAARHSERAGGAHKSERWAESSDRSPSWSWRPGSPTVDLSPALARKAGLGGGEEGGRRVRLMELFRKLDPEGRRAARQAVGRVMDTGQGTAFAHADVEGDARLAHHVRNAGNSVWGRTETIDRGAPGAFASRDPLTGLRDLRAGRSFIDQQLEAGSDEQPTLVLLLLAVSRFDAINAAFGRSTGDTVLQAAGRRIERLVEADGQRRFVARLAGPEFAVILTAPTGLGEGRFSPASWSRRLPARSCRAIT